MQDKLKNWIMQTLKLEKEPVLMHPKELMHGDYSFFSNSQNIEEDANILRQAQGEFPEIQEIKVVGKFINFYLSRKFFTSATEEILNNPDFGKNDLLKSKKIMVEYTDPNPFKPFHIGHLMTNAIGESVARILENSGANVLRANYQGDVGPHVAKAIWGMMQLKKEGKNPKEGDKKATDEVQFLGDAYVLGSDSYEDSPEAKAEIDAINKKVYEKSDAEINALYDWGRKVSLEHFEELYKKLGTKFDHYFFESQTAPVGIFIVEELLAKGILEKSDGAVVFKGEQYGLHTRVFMNSQALPTYETKELGLSKMKFDRQDFDQSIVITASEQQDYFSVVLKVLEFADHRAANRTKHVTHGMMRFAEGKMSSRKGNVITGESLISDVEKLVQEKVKDRELSDEEKNTVAEQVAVAAIKYSILKQSPGRDIIFDFNKSLSFEGDSGPYLQYTHARACSILRKAAEQNISASLDLKNASPAGDIEKLLSRFPAVVERAQKELAPQLVATFLINLASAFNSYYAENIIVDAEKSESSYRVALTGAVKNVLENGLWLLGIKAPERM
jgi:arginyl-tRNA synthetase